jgi:hypothetical protein
LFHWRIIAYLFIYQAAPLQLRMLNTRRPPVANGKKNLYRVSKPQGRPPHTSMPKNWKGKTEFERDEKDDNHKDAGLEFCTLRPRDDRRAGGNDLLQCSWAFMPLPLAQVRNGEEHSYEQFPTSSMRCPKRHWRGPVGWMGFFWQQWMRWGVGRSMTKYSQPHEWIGGDKSWRWMWKEVIGTFQFHHVITFHDCPSYPRSSAQKFTLLTSVLVDEKERPQNILI